MGREIGQGVDGAGPFLKCSNAPIQDEQFPKPHSQEEPIRSTYTNSQLAGREDRLTNKKSRGAEAQPVRVGHTACGAALPRSLVLQCALSLPAVRVPLYVLLALRGGDPGGCGFWTKAPVQDRLLFFSFLFFLFWPALSG